MSPQAHPDLTPPDLRTHHAPHDAVQRMARAAHGAPKDGDRFVTTYGYIRDLFRQTEHVRVGYEHDSARHRAEADDWREEAMALQAAMLRRHPTGEHWPCGDHKVCATRREVQAVIRECRREADLRRAERELVAASVGVEAHARREEARRLRTARP